MKTYDITFNSGVTVRSYSHSLNDAIAVACRVEKAPNTAIKTWRVVPTKRQIAKTKSLMRGL